MPTPEIEEFARILVEEVRDATIEGSDSNLRSDVTHVIAKRWQASGAAEDLDRIAAVIIPDVVDSTIFHLLRAVDDGQLSISFKSSSGKVVDLPKDGHGELSGWFIGTGGWRALYSKQRFVDDFANRD